MEVQVESNASWKNLTCQINCVSVVGYWIECITISLRSLLYHFWNNQLINQKLLFCAHLFYLSNHKLKPSFYSWHQGFWKSFTRPHYTSFGSTFNVNILSLSIRILTDYMRINRFNKFIFENKTITNLGIQIYRLVLVYFLSPPKISVMMSINFLT